MFNKIVLTLLAILLLAAMPGCDRLSPAASETNTPANQQLLPIVSGKTASLQLDASADGTTQALSVGEVMSLSLDSNPSTGYGWYATSSNPDVLAQAGEPEYTDSQLSGSTPMMGAAGTQTFYFQALSAGSVTLTMEYKRGWETDVAPQETITVTVEVK